ncbi:MAG: heparinase II/III family protein [Planctomycetia bacterium]|nr:heparinase II/III family protein [Planctomycetia bacterium]
MKIYQNVFWLVFVLFFSIAAVNAGDPPASEKQKSTTSDLPFFPGGSELGTGWSKKVNVNLDWNAKEKSLLVDMDGSEFRFGWFQRKLPKTDYSKYAGIIGRYRVPKEQKGGSIQALIVLHGKNSEYYSAQIGLCSESRGDWVDFLILFSQFNPSRGATQSFLSPERMTEGDHLEISVGSIPSKFQIEFADFRLIDKEKEKSVRKQYNRNRLGRFLKSDEELADAVHPNLLLFGKRLDRIRAKAKEGGVQQQGYEHVVQLAEQAMKKINADDPFGKVFHYSLNSDLNPHVNRGRFEGLFGPLVVPLETLAAAAVITGNDKYGKHAAKALVNMARTIDAETPEIAFGFYYTRTFYVRALAFGYDWLYHYLTPEERKEVKITLLGFVQDIYDQSWTAGWGHHPLSRVWNWDPGLVSCAGLGVLAMKGETILEEDAMLVQFRRHLRDYLTFGIDFDGSCHEGPAYISYGIGSGVQFAECLRDAGLGDLFLDTNWQLIAPWLVAEQLPDQAGWNNLSDCGYGVVAGCPVYAYTCGRLAELAKSDPVKKDERLPAKANTTSGLKYIQHFSERPGDKLLSWGASAELMGWCWNRSIQAKEVSKYSDLSALAYLFFYEECPVAKDPGIFLPDSQFFRGRGLAVSRFGGYGTDAVHLAVEAGPHATGHDQSDKGTFTFHAYGSPLVIDSGYGNDGENEKSGSSFAHNIVIIDGQGQPLNWHNNSNGEITGYSQSELFDWIRTDAKDAWNFHYSQWKEIPSGMDVEKADRHYLFVKGIGKEVPPYLITYDDFRKKDGKPHEYTWQWHLSPEFEVNIQKDRWTASQNRNGYMILTANAAHPSGKAVFNLTAPEDGKYHLIGLTRCAGEDKGKSDSFFLGINNQPRQCWGLTASSAFAWSILNDQNTSVFTVLSLKKGEKIRCELSVREPDAQLAFLALKPVEADLPPFPTETASRPDCIAAADAVQDSKTPFLLKTSITKTTETNLTVFPIGTPNGKTGIQWFETSKDGIHPKLTHSVQAAEPGFLMLMIPRPDQSIKLPRVRPLKQTGKTGMEIRWPEGPTDKILFQPGKNGMEPIFRREK